MTTPMNTTPTPEDYTIDPQTLLDAHAKTTQGAWETDRDSSFIYCDDEELANFNNLNADREEDEANAAFCALAHNGIVEILERLKRAEAERDGLKVEVGALKAMLADAERDARAEIKDLKEDIKDLKAELREERSRGRY